jgi:hypothetical protein
MIPCRNSPNAKPQCHGKEHGPDMLPNFFATEMLGAPCARKRRSTCNDDTALLFR